MDKILTTIVIATALATTGCSSFKTIDRTDVIPTESQIQAQLAIEKKKEKDYEASKTGYPDTYIQQQNPAPNTTPKPAPKPVSKPTTTVSTPIVMTPTTPAPTATKPVVTPTQVAQEPATSPVTVSSVAKKPIREIIIYPDDTPPHDSATASKTPTVVVTPIASGTTKPPVTTTPDAGTVTIYKVLVGKFPTKEATEPLLNELKETYKEAFIRKNEGKEEYSVQIAASTNEKASNDLVAKLKDKGYKVFILTVKK